MFEADKGQPAPLDGSHLRIGIVQARFNEGVTGGLLQACLAELDALGVPAQDIAHHTVPGALEVPLALKWLAHRGEYDALIALGCVIRGETTHYDYVCGESARKLMDLAADRRLAIGNGILTVENEEQAWRRARPEDLDKGGDAAEAARALLGLRQRLLGGG